MSDRGSSRDSLTVAVGPTAPDGRLAVRVRGEIDLANAQLLQQRLADAIDGGALDLVLDVSGVSFCDVAALNVILRTRSKLSSRGGRLTLIGPCNPLKIMIRALALEGELPVTTRASADSKSPTLR
jgi:anti-anti-sigma factor